MRKVWFIYAAALAAAAIGSFVAAFRLPPRVHPAVQPNLPVHTSYFSSRGFFDEAYRLAAAGTPKPSGHVYGGIVPHHLMVKDEIAAMFSGLEGTSYDTVVLVSPNHFSQGVGSAITSRSQWLTPYGTLEPNLSLVGQLVAAGAAVEEDPFKAEHGISGLVGFIKKSFPHATFVPLILKVNSRSELDSALANAIFQSVDPERTLVLASVDFSHYMPVSVANFHDEMSRGVVESFDYGRLRNLEIDSPPSLDVVLRYLELAHAQQPQLLFHTNSGELLEQPDIPTTSHLLYYFTSGQPSPARVANFLFTGDIMLDRNVKTRVGSCGLGYVLDDLAGQEKRFFGGSDLVSANLEGAVTNGGAHYPPEAGIDFAFNPSTVAQLHKYGFNFFNIANNHTLDQGKRGVDETNANLAELGFNFSGCPDSQVGVCTATTTKIGGLVVGMAGFSMVYHTFDLDAAVRKVAELASSTDFVVVNIHWGTEYQHQFSQSQREVAHRLIDAGADLIIGSHPHVVQGIERYAGKLIFYSLGNFIFDQYFSPDTQSELAVGIAASWDSPGAEPSYAAYLFPIQSKQSQLQLMAGSARQTFLNQLASWSSLGRADSAGVAAGWVAP